MNSLEMADVLDSSDNHKYLPPIHSSSLYPVCSGQLESLFFISLLVFKRLNIKKLEFSQRQDVVRA